MNRIPLRLFAAAACLAGWITGSGCDLGGGGSSAAPGGQISVISSPEGAKVFCNGKTYGLTPTSVGGLGPGRHLITVEKEGYRTARKTVSLLSGQKLNSAEFQLEPVTGLALVHSDPPGADVEIGGAFRGRTPLLLKDFPLGEHRVAISKRGYLPKEIVMKLDSERPIQVDEILTSNSATVIFTSLPLGADVDINGIRRGKTPCTISDISAGRHKIEVSLDGYYKYQEEISLSPGDTVEIDAPLKAIPGSLRVVTVPTDAKVYLNNQYKGQSPAEIPDLPPGDYRVSVELMGYANDNRVVKVENGAARVEEFRLIKNSGIIEIVTQPAGVNVYIDGEGVGVTKAGRTDVISEAFRVDLLSAGPHRVQLTKKGYTKIERVVNVKPEAITPVREELKRIFVVNYLVVTGTSADEIWKGRLDQKSSAGDIRLELKPGLYRTFKAEEIITHRSIKEQPREE